MQKPTDGVRRPVSTARRRPHRQSLIRRVNERTIGFARQTRTWLHTRAGGSVATAATSARTALRPFASTERVLPIGVAATVAVASLLAVLPAQAGATGGTSGAGEGIRIAIGGPNARTADTDFALDRQRRVRRGHELHAGRAPG